MIAMLMMQMAINYIVRMIAVLNGFVSTVGTVAVFFSVTFAHMFRRASGWILDTHCDGMLTHGVLLLIYV